MWAMTHPAKRVPRLPRGPLLFIGVLLTLGTACDPAWTMMVRQSVAPATESKCIVSTLQKDRRIDTIGTPRDSRVAFALRDSTIRGGRRPGFITLWPSKDSLPLMEVAVVWRFPAGGIFADSLRTIELASFSQEAAEMVRLACAPDVPRASSCRIAGPPRLSRNSCTP
jgi:hypothetical protein